MAQTSLTRTPSGAGNRKTWTLSTWVKRSGLGNNIILEANPSGGSSNTNYIGMQFAGGFQLVVGGWTSNFLATTQFFRDTSAWYHIVLRVDTTQGTADDRMRLYINGEQVTSFATRNNPGQNDDTGLNATVGTFIGKTMDGYMAQTILADGQSYAPTVFGSTNANGIWVPNTGPSVTYGTNGFKLDFAGTGTAADASGFGADSSGNGNHFASSNLGTNPSTTDTTQNNFATWNPLVVRGGSDDLVYTEGNTGVSSNQHATNNYTFGTQGFANGKWYWEVKCETVGGEMHIGIVDSGSSTTGYPSIYREYRNNGQKNTNTGSASSFGNTYTDGDIIGVAVDLDNTSIYYSKNGTWQNSGNPESGASKTGAAFTDISSTNFPNFVLAWVAGAGVNGGADMKAFANFGNPPYTIASGNADANGYGNFEYAVPSGYYALCTKNLAAYGG